MATTIFINKDNLYKITKQFKSEALECWNVPLFFRCLMTEWLLVVYTRLAEQQWVMIFIKGIIIIAFAHMLLRDSNYQYL